METPIAPFNYSYNICVAPTNENTTINLQYPYFSGQRFFFPQNSLISPIAVIFIPRHCIRRFTLRGIKLLVQLLPVGRMKRNKQDVMNNSKYNFHTWAFFAS